MSNLSPAEIVAQLDRYIVNQVDAKRAVALAIRNRDRRRRIEPRLGTLAQTPHVLLSGPSGVGKTTLVQRAAQIIGAPLVQADPAGIHAPGDAGRGVALIVQNLIDIEIRDRSLLPTSKLAEGDDAGAHQRLSPHRRSGPAPVRAHDTERPPPGRPSRASSARRAARGRVAAAIEQVERQGIVLLDDIDRLAVRETGDQSEAAGEALQRALIPLLEGADVVTDYGPVRTAHLLVIATGAFTTTRIADLAPELVGRFSVRAELHSLDSDDFEHILTDSGRSLRDYYVELLATDGISIDFTPDGLHEIAALAAEANARGHDLGARRLVHVIEHVLAEAAFGDAAPAASATIDATLVRERCAELVDDEDLEQFIL